MEKPVNLDPNLFIELDASFRKMKGTTGELIRTMEKQASITKQTESSIKKEIVARENQINKLLEFGKLSPAQDSILTALEGRMGDLSTTLMTKESQRILAGIEVRKK